MRSTYIVSYDVKNDKRLRQILKTMRGYGNHVQYSVFLCRLSEKEKILMLTHLMEILKKDEDSLMIINIGTSGNSAERRIEYVGVIPDNDQMEILVV